jgi:hypothetical protein
VRGVLDPPVSAFSLSLYRHPFLYTLFSSRFTLIINNNKETAAAQVHDWVVRRLGGILSSVDHRVKIHNITPATVKERGDVERCGNTGLCNITKTTRLDRLTSSSTYSDSRFYFDTYAFWKITTVFSGTPDAHQEDGWCPRA